MIDPYTILGLDDSMEITDDVVKAASRKVFKTCHPDIIGAMPNLSPQEAEKLINKYNEAYEAYSMIKTADLRESFSMGYSGDGMIKELQELCNDYVNAFISHAVSDSDKSVLESLTTKYHKERYVCIQQAARMRNAKVKAEKKLGKIKKKTSGKDPFREALDQELEKIGSEIAELEDQAKTFKWKIDFTKKYYEETVEKKTPTWNISVGSGILSGDNYTHNTSGL